MALNRHSNTDRFLAAAKLGPPRWITARDPEWAVGIQAGTVELFGLRTASARPWQAAAIDGLPAWVPCDDVAAAIFGDHYA